MLLVLLHFLALLAACVSYPIEPLSEQVSPKYYSVELALENNGSFTGVVTIGFNTSSATLRDNKLVLNNDGLELVNAHLKDHNEKEEFLTLFSTNTTLRTVTFQLGHPLQKSSFYELKISFFGKASNDGRGLFSLDDGKSFMTNFHPFYARRVFPCFDSPDKKAQFSLVFMTTNNYVVSNMPLESSTSTPEGMTRYVFKSTPNIPPHSFFLLTSQTEFTKYASLPWGDVGFYLYPQFTKMQFFNEIVHIADSPLLRELWNKAGMEKLDVLVVRNFKEKFFSGYGVVVLSKDLVQFDNYQSTTEMKREAALTVLEAFLRVYFGSVVSPFRWESNWLSSSLSYYLRFLAFNNNLNWGDMDEYMLLDVHLKTLTDPMNSTTSPIALSDSFNTTEELEDYVTGSSKVKGASVLSMLESLITENDLVSVFVDFMDNYKYGLGITEYNLFTTLTTHLKSLPVSMDGFLHSWIFETNVPLVSMTRENYSVKLTQVRTEGMKYLKPKEGSDLENSLVEVSENVPSNWIFPVSYVTQKRPHYNPNRPGPIWFLGHADSIVFNEAIPYDEWVAINVDGKSPFLSNYNDDTWTSLGMSLTNNVNSLTPSTRAKLVSDAFWLAKVGKANYTTVLHFLTYLDKEVALAPWVVAIEGFKDLYSWIYFTKDKSVVPDFINLKSDFEIYVVNRLVGIYNKLGLTGLDANKEDSSLRREVVSALCYFGYEPCRSATVELYKKMINNNTFQILSNDMRPNLLCAGLRETVTEDEWLKFYQQLFSPDLRDEVLDDHLDVLACPVPIGDSSVPIKKYLTTVLLDKNEFPLSKVSLAYKTLYTKASHINQALYFLLDRCELISKLKPAKKAELLLDIAPYLSTTYHADLLKKFTEKHKKASKEVLKAVDSAQVMVHNKQKFIESTMYDIQKGLVSQPSPPTQLPTTLPTTTSSGSSTGTPGTGSTASTTNSSVTPTIEPAPTPAPMNSEGLSTGSIVGIVFGVLIGLAVIGGVLYFSFKKDGWCS
ncbi:aminopeptidase Ey-like isoform X2 [Cimex lectularius]|uniref:Aminopeptidase n=1 Tax=Cimex lectularius TaxID=79782 RepID=A0A8I6TGA4_CIMLE|nr:aminopeptidase Ey-like isoform X2 [Cimex lectularius]